MMGKKIKSGLEQKLFDDGYWKMSAGDDKNEPNLITTKKWSVMIDLLLGKNLSKPITERQIKNYIKTF